MRDLIELTKCLMKYKCERNRNLVEIIRILFEQTFYSFISHQTFGQSK